jgi:hypothetical protein
MPDSTPAQATARLADLAQLWRGRADHVGMVGGAGTTALLVAAATGCLVAGRDSPALRELAGVSPDEARSVVGPLLDATLRELHLEAEERSVAMTLDVERLNAFVALVLEDVRASRLDLEVEVVPGSALGEDPRTTYLRIEGGLTMLSNGHHDDRPAEELARLADLVHQWVVEELPSHHRPTNWPPCPLHPDTHPLEVGLVQDDVVWLCPSTGRAQARVGGLAQ